LKDSGEPTLCTHKDSGSLRCPVLDGEGAPACTWEGHLHSLDILPTTGPPPPSHESSAVEAYDPLPSKFVPGRETASVLQISKRPKLRAKDVAHRQSLTTADAATPATRFWNLDSSFVAPVRSAAPLSGHAQSTSETGRGSFEHPFTSKDAEPGWSGRWLSPASTLMPGGLDGEAVMVTLMFGAQGVGVPAFASMPIRDLRAAIQLFWGP
jgi:hypothetical protein